MTVQMDPDTYGWLVKWDMIYGPRRGGAGISARVEVGSERKVCERAFAQALISKGQGSFMRFDH